MLKHLMERRNEEKGFTLIELMVVVLIIGILIAIALPTFLGARGRAQDKQAQSSVRNVLAAGKACFTDSGAYTACTAANLAPQETSLSLVAAASTGPTVVSVAPHATNANVIYIASWSSAGTCFAIRDNQGATAGGITSGTTYARAGTTQANCDTGNAAVTGATYGAAW